jgi:hypothetical protein
MSRQAEGAVTGEELWALKGVVTPKQGELEKCRRCSGRNGLACTRGGCIPCSTAGRLRAGRRAVRAVGGFPDGSR